MWDRVARCIRENASEVLGVSRGRAGHHRGDWWWNEEVKKKVETKKGAYAKLVESKDEEEKRVNKKEYKLARKEAKLAVTAAKTAAFESLHLNDEGDKAIVLGELEHSEECRDFSYCRRFKACTLPLDTAKVRLQLQKKAVEGDGIALPKYRGLLGTVGTIAKEEGVASLWKGIVPGLHRQCIYGGLRIGMYEPVKNLYVGKDHVGDVPLMKKILAALTTGAFGITVANPTDLVKVRLQAEGKLPAGVPRRYSGALNAYSTIVKQEGVRALWTGLGPNIGRNAIINAAELASYDQVKEAILKIPGFKDNVFTHLIAGLGAGFFAVCIGSPVDVVKSRMMGDSAYKNTLDCFVKTLKNDGPLAFYKGFIPNFGRLGSWNVIMFLTLEQVKKLVKNLESA
ncbi:Mitochondrial uncoupling protein 1 [Capsicum annuum]|nr:Mitochondrial uncoupling protein 1 [Capsicum annuum]